MIRLQQLAIQPRPVAPRQDCPAALAPAPSLLPRRWRILLQALQKVFLLRWRRAVVLAPWPRRVMPACARLMLPAGQWRQHSTIWICTCPCCSSPPGGLLPGAILPLASLGSSKEESVQVIAA